MSNMQENHILKVLGGISLTDVPFLFPSLDLFLKKALTFKKMKRKHRVISFVQGLGLTGASLRKIFKCTALKHPT
jgi:hypothetical protein